MILMDDKTRIKKDIVMFEENLEEFNKKKIINKNKIIELATQYYEDSKYYYNNDI